MKIDSGGFGHIRASAVEIKCIDLGGVAGHLLAT